MIESEHALDPVTGLPLFSLYSDRRKPTPEMLDSFDVLVIDLFDIALVRSGLAEGMTPTAIVLLRFATVLPAAFLIALGIERARPLAWTIGLGPTPWSRRGASRVTDG